MNQDPQSNLIELSENPYPGRGIVIGKDETGYFLVQIYWIMGRSANSRNRVFGYDPQTGRVFTEAANPAEMKDPSLIIYNAMSEQDGVFAVSNGAQTDDIVVSAEDFDKALWQWSYEPDSPNFTPRISAICCPNRSLKARIGIARMSMWGQSCDRIFYNFFELGKGVGLCATTYSGDGDPLPTFRDEPYPLPVKGPIKEVAIRIWEALNEENRVSLAVKFIDWQTGESTVHVINKYRKVQ